MRSMSYLNANCLSDKFVVMAKDDKIPAQCRTNAEPYFENGPIKKQIL
jgi:hypothetical protein